MNNMFNGSYRGKRVLITGHTGFKGSWLSIWLEKLGAEVIGYSQEPSTKPSMFEICQIDSIITSIIGDIRDLDKLKLVFEKYKPEIVFHLAAQPLVRYSYKNPHETYETNIMGTINVLEAAKCTDGVQAVVVITTDKCYENKEWSYGYRENDVIGGHDPYSSSKGCVEIIVAAYRKSFYTDKGIALASVRAGNVIGGGDWAEDRLMPDFIRASIKENPIIIRNPLATRPWQHVLEPLSGYLLLGTLMIQDKAKYSDAWNFGPKDTDVLKVEEVLKIAIETWGKGKIELDIGSNPHEASLLKLDINKAKAFLKWHPLYDVNKAIEKTIHWYKMFYDNTNEDMNKYTLMQIEEYENEAKSQKIIWSE